MHFQLTSINHRRKNNSHWHIDTFFRLQAIPKINSLQFWHVEFILQMLHFNEKLDIDFLASLHVECHVK